MRIFIGITNDRRVQCERIFKTSLVVQILNCSMTHLLHGLKNYERVCVTLHCSVNSYKIEND